MMRLDKIVNSLIANDTEYIFTKAEDGVYTSVVSVGNFQLLIELVYDESDELVLISGTLVLGNENIHTHTYVGDTYEQVFYALINLYIKANNVVKKINEFSEWK